MNKKLIYGKSDLDRVVSVEVSETGSVEVFREHAGGVTSVFMTHKFWLLYSKQLNSKFQQLDGDLHYNYLMEYDTDEKYREIISNSYKKRYDFYTARDPKTNFLLKSGVTSFKGMKIDEVSVLSFDIETTGLDPKARDAQVLLISNTFRKNGKTVKKLFCVDDYDYDGDMIGAWVKWVREINPSIVLGHYILGFDLPYLQERGGKLMLGRDGSDMKIQEYTRQFRKDASQSYDFNDCLIYGREVIDTKFLAIKYDIKREFPNYSLKPMIEFLGLQKKNRSFVDASKMKQLWADLSMRQKIKDYALDDSEDAMKLFDFMAPQFFYYAMHIPMSFQQINNTATGTQINNFLVRSYLQNNHSIPKGDQIEKFPGGLVFATPGVHKNVLRFDVASLYPSIMLEYGIGPGSDKDPLNHFVDMLRFFTDQRLANKAKAKETKEKYFKDLSDGQKIVINSCYGMMGAPGLNFNRESSARAVTRIGVEVLTASTQHMGGIAINGTTDADTEEEAESA